MLWCEMWKSVWAASCLGVRYSHGPYRIAFALQIAMHFLWIIYLLQNRLKFDRHEERKRTKSKQSVQCLCVWELFTGRSCVVCRRSHLIKSKLPRGIHRNSVMQIATVWLVVTMDAFPRQCAHLTGAWDYAAVHQNIDKATTDWRAEKNWIENAMTIDH